MMTTANLSVPQKRVRSQLEQLQLLCSLTDAVSRADDLEAIYLRALDGLERALDARRSSILLFDGAGVMRFVASRGLSERYQRAVEGHSPWTSAATSPAPIVVPDVLEEPSLAALRSTVLDEGIRALGFIPLVHAGRLLGKCMIYYEQPHPFEAEEIELAQTIGRLVAFAVDRKRTESSLQRAVDAVGFLAATGAALEASLDYELTLESVARISVPFLADACAVHLVDPRSEPRLVAAVRSESERLTPVPGLDDAVTGNVSPLLRDVLRTGRPRRLSGAAAQPDEVDSSSFALIRAAGFASCMVVPLRNNERIIGSMSFLSAARSYERADLELAEALAKRCAMAIENARLYREVQESDRRKDEFVAMLAHELRNPLAPMMTALEVVKIRPDDAQRVPRALGVIERQVRHMARLVDDLLDVSRITRGKIELRRERLDLGRLVLRVVEGARPELDRRRHDVAVSIAPGLWLEADPVRLEQVLGNLLHNAAKYSDDGGVIAISAEAGAGVARLTVRDQGVGIAPELIPRIFDLFTQGEHALDRSRGGLGIGLTLVRRLVEMHGGAVSVTSEGPGKGAEFEVRLPLSEAPTAAPTSRPASPSGNDGSGRRVLVVDDNVDAATLLGEALEASGHIVHVVHDGPAALSAASEFQPDVVLLDIGLPGMDGYEVARRIVASPAPQPLLIALSGYGQPQDRARSAQAGMSHHLVKPIELDALTQLL